MIVKNKQLLYFYITIFSTIMSAYIWAVTYEYNESFIIRLLESFCVWGNLTFGFYIGYQIKNRFIHMDWWKKVICYLSASILFCATDYVLSIEFPKYGKYDTIILTIFLSLGSIIISIMT